MDCVRAHQIGLFFARGFCLLVCTGYSHDIHTHSLVGFLSSIYLV